MNVAYQKLTIFQVQMQTTYELHMKFGSKKMLVKKMPPAKRTLLPLILILLTFIYANYIVLIQVTQSR